MTTEEPRVGSNGKLKSPPRSKDIASSLRIRYKTPFGHIHMTVVFDLEKDQELEIFAQVGRAGGPMAADIEGLCRLASFILRAGYSIRDIAKQLKGIGMAYASNNKQATSVPDSLACAIEKYLEYKDKFGLRKLILGEAVLPDESDEEKKDPETLDDPPTNCEACHA
jgi:ribonucleoside-diphosphate reductase alpha chain